MKAPLAAGGPGAIRSALARALPDILSSLAARLQRRGRALALAAALAGCSAPLPTTAAEMSAAPVPPEAQELVTLVNRHRDSVGCRPLAWHPGAAEVALRHSRDMVERGFFSHTNPDGLDPFDRLARAGVSFRAAGENLARGWTTAQAAFQGWLGSPTHRAGIENCAYTHHGMGLYGDRWTHVFLRP